VIHKNEKFTRTNNKIIEVWVYNAKVESVELSLPMTCFAVRFKLEMWGE